MKQIIIFLLIVIIAILGYNQYKKYKRFSFSEYEYKALEAINVKEADKNLLLDYYEAIEILNGYVITQWGAEGIDVRNPDDDDDETIAAVAEYRRKLANVKFYEAQLLATERPKIDILKEEKKSDFIKKMFYADPSGNTLRIGEKSALIYEIQRFLNEKGDSIRHDGIFREETFNSLRSFEEKNQLYPDGKLDALTLEYLLK